ncbi:MAG: ABC-type transport auxiliary lipoprotein family protein [Nitrospirales bacterium]
MKHWHLWILSSLGFFLASCMGGPAPQDHYYRLELPEPTSQFHAPPLQGTLQITRPWADALTSERHLLYRQNMKTSQVFRHAYHRWSDSPTLILQQQIAHYLRGSGIASQVVTPELRVKANYQFSCRISKMERVLDNSPRVIIELELGVIHMRNREAMLLRTYYEELPINTHKISDSIEGYNQALTIILNQFIKDTSNLPTAIPIKHHP